MEAFNDAKALEAVCKFRAAAIADGWSHEPTYGDGQEDEACTLKRDGFTIQVYSRDTYAAIAAWGPDGLTLDPVAVPYPGFAWFEAGLRRCNLCGAGSAETFRYAFAGRACAACLPKAKAETEKPGWTN
jgi:hypothetical protein